MIRASPKIGRPAKTLNHQSCPKFRSNRICFTLNNYTPQEAESFVLDLKAKESFVNYAIVGKEVGQNGTPHLQGFIHLKTSFLKAKDGGVLTWRGIFPGLARAHLEKAFGTDAQSQKYCEKDGNLLIEVGTPTVCVDVFHRF